MSEISKFITERDYENSYIFKDNDRALKYDLFPNYKYNKKFNDEHNLPNGFCDIDYRENTLEYLCINCVKSETKQPITLSEDVYVVKEYENEKNKFYSLNSDDYLYYPPVLKVCSNSECLRLINFDYLDGVDINDGEYLMRHIDNLLKELKVLFPNYDKSPTYHKFIEFLEAYQVMIVNVVSDYLSIEITKVYIKKFKLLLLEFIA